MPSTAGRSSSGLNGVCIIGHGRSNSRGGQQRRPAGPGFRRRPGPGEDPGRAPPDRAGGGERRMIFEDRVSIVTGASQGSARPVAREFAREGATVVLVDVQKGKLEESPAPSPTRAAGPSSATPTSPSSIRPPPSSRGRPRTFGGSTLSSITPGSPATTSSCG